MKGDLLLTGNTLLAALVTGCGTLGTPEAASVQVPQSPEELARCKVAATHENPIVTEWSSSEKVNLETRARSGAVLVEYFGCKMRIVPECQASGSYRWQRTTVTTDMVEVRNADELYTNLPLGAANLEGELEAKRRDDAAHDGVRAAPARRVRFATPSERRPLSRSNACRPRHSRWSLSDAVDQPARGRRGRERGAARPDRRFDGPRRGRGTRGRKRRILRTFECRRTSRRLPISVQVFLSPLPRTVARAGPPGTVNARFLRA